MDVGQSRVVRGVAESMHSLGYGIPILPGEGILGTGGFVMDAFSCVVFQGGLQVGDPGLEGGRGEAWSSHSRGCEYRSFDVSDMLVEEQLVSSMTCY